MRRLAFVLATLVAACHASSPIAPSPRLEGVMILYNTPTQTFSSQVFGVRAYAVDSDGAYRHITDSAEWGSSNQAIVRVFAASNRSFVVNGPGTAIITAVYQDTTGYLPVRVTQQTVSASTGSALRLASPNVMLTGIGGRLQVSASLFANGRFTQVTSAAEWNSSNPSVAIVEGGTVTSQGVGTTEITATYQGVSDSYFISVHPARVRQ